MTIIHTLRKLIENLHLNLISKRKWSYFCVTTGSLLSLKDFVPSQVVNVVRHPIFGDWSRLVQEVISFATYLELLWDTILLSSIFSFLLAYSKMYLF